MPFPPEMLSGLRILLQIANKKNVPIWVVGGFLRNYILGRPNYDLDLVLPAGSIPIAQSFAKKIRGAFVLLDEDTRCARVVKKYGDVLFTFDLVSYRGKTLRQDLRHRDFTINTLVLPLAEVLSGRDFRNKIKDYHQARKDIQQKIIRMVDPCAFQEDPLRILRAFSLRAVFGFKIESVTKARIKKDCHLIANVSVERIREELFKILSSGRAASVLGEMDRMDVLLLIIPQIKIMDQCSQGGYHHLDVWRHSLETLRQMERLILHSRNKDLCSYLSELIGAGHSRLTVLKLAALLHDIGKPETRRKEKDRFSFHGHEHAGKKIVRHVAKMLKLSTSERQAAEDMVLWHLRPGYLSNYKNPTPKAIYRYFRDTKEEAASIALLSMADQMATRGPLSLPENEAHHLKICSALIEDFFKKKKVVPFVPLVSGHDVMTALRIKSSPVVGKILMAVTEAQHLKKISTKAEAINLAEKIYKDQE